MKKTLLLTAFMLNVGYAAPRVVSSIYPLQQIANEITGENTELVADSYLSPHTYAVKPSDAYKVKNADIMLWIGASMMGQLDPYVAQRGVDKITITASQLPKIKLLEGHDHDHDHDHDSHDKHDEHDHDNHAEHDDHDKDEHDAHQHDDKADKHEKHDDKHDDDFSYDPHLWLSTENAQVIATALTDELIKLDSTNADTYRRNLAAFIQKLDDTRTFISGNFESNPAPAYFIFHEAYAYFENEFGVEHIDVIRTHAAQAPKTRHLNELRKKIASHPNACLFREPQFQSAIVDKLTADSTVKVATLDPVGYEKDKNIGYTTILRNIAKQITACQPQ